MVRGKLSAFRTIEETSASTLQKQTPSYYRSNTRQLWQGPFKISKKFNHIKDAHSLHASGWQNMCTQTFMDKYMIIAASSYVSSKCYFTCASSTSNRDTIWIIMSLGLGESSECFGPECSFWRHLQAFFRCLMLLEFVHSVKYIVGRLINRFRRFIHLNDVNEKNVYFGQRA